MRLANLPLLRCPVCYVALTLSEGSRAVGEKIIDGKLVCGSGHVYWVAESIPRFETFARDINKTEESGWHDSQATEHDPAMIVDEHHLFSWLTYCQLFEALPVLRGLNPSSILVAMCGSGFEFDVWSRLTLNVWGTDLSVGSLKNAQQRAKLLGLTGELVRADVESMPFDENSFDMVAVHHGLHHMPCLGVSLSELLRVCRRWCVLCEPVDGVMRRLLKLVGASPSIEPGGTRVHDIREDELERLVSRNSARLTWSSRLFFPKPRALRPTAFYRLADRLHLAAVLVRPLRGFNSLFGRWVGTKGTFLISKSERW